MRGLTCSTPRNVGSSSATARFLTLPATRPTTQSAYGKEIEPCRPRSRADELRRRPRDKFPKGSGTRSRGGETRGANHLLAGVVSVAIFLPERRLQILQAGRTNPRPEHTGAGETGETIADSTHRVVVREAHGRGLPQHGGDDRFGR